MSLNREKLQRKLESLGLQKVKQKIRLGDWNEQKTKFAQAWVSGKEDQLSLEASVRAEAREEDALSLAKEANTIAREANRIAREDADLAERSARWAKIAAIIAAIAAIISVATTIIIACLTNQ